MWRVFLLSLTLLGLCLSETDPCSPNPCGDNTRCSSSPNSGNPVISCECLLGTQVPEGGDPFDGCVEKKSSVQRAPAQTGDRLAEEEEEEVEEVKAISPILPLTTQSPIRNVETARDAIEKQEEVSDSRIQEGKRPTFILPRRNEGSVGEGEGEVIRPKEIVDVDTPDLFPDECLVHEDCRSTDFCSPPPQNKCTDACTLDVCGSGAVCSSQLHRPVCSCPDGYEGNPYDKCTKTPSREGMRFRRWADAL